MWITFAWPSGAADWPPLWKIEVSTADCGHIASPHADFGVKMVKLTRTGAPLLKLPVSERSATFEVYGRGTLSEGEMRFYDLAVDPEQEHPPQNVATEVRMATLMRRLMHDNGVPQQCAVAGGPDRADRLRRRPAALPAALEQSRCRDPRDCDRAAHQRSPGKWSERPTTCGRSGRAL